MLLCIVLFFFFKQKTAYEMRISDWSSDVCSSDLIPNAWQRSASNCHNSRRFNTPHCQCHILQSPTACAEETGVIRSGDRKSVVSGKSVSVRVDLGGRRIITKQTPNT